MRVDLLLEVTARAERDHFWFRGFRRFIRPLLVEAAGGRADNRLLDCGCGTGVNLDVLAEFGTPWGFDLTWTGLRTAAARGQTRVARATVADVPFPSATFDVVTSFDVLYCLDDAVEHAAVAEMWRVLKPGGSLIVNVAAMPILRGNHSILSGERRRYDRTRLRRLLETSGFDVHRLTYTNATLFPAMLAVRLAQRAVGFAPEERATTEITVPPAPINAVLSAALALEAAVLRVTSLPFGSSLLCLAKKPA